MPRRKIIPDDWLYHDLKGENGTDKQEEAHRFLEKLKEKCDKLVVLKESLIWKKFCELSTDSRPQIIIYSKLLWGEILLDSLKCTWFEPSALPHSDMPADTPAKDEHIYQLARANCDAVVVTTDNILIEFLKKERLCVDHRDVFLAQYLAD